jgi:catechol 2,3-dioxygenase-like lactoylglutathione lyase family enzyme
MKTFAVAAAIVLHAGLALAQAPGSAAAAPTGLVVNSGNFFSPIVGNLDAAVAFYRDGLGLDVQGEPGDADANPGLRNMFGLPDARLRWQIARPPAVTGGVEIVEISKAGGRAVERRLQDAGAFTLIVQVRDLDAPLARLKKLGTPVVTLGGAPVAATLGGQKARMIVVRDPDGHFIQLVQQEQPPATKAPADANVVGIRVRLTVADVERSLRLYRDALGLKSVRTPDFSGDAAVLRAFGVEDGQYRVALLEVPTSGLVFELMDFKGIERATAHASIADPGSTRMQLQVRDIDAAVAALKRAGGVFVSTGGAPLEIPGRGGNLKVGIVRDPDDLFIVLFQPPAAPAR